MSITIKELSAVVSETAGITKVLAEDVIAALFTEISDSLKRDEDVVVRNFGRFYTHTRPARNGRNPKTGEAIQISSKTVIKLSPRGDLK